MASARCNRALIYVRLRGLRLHAELRVAGGQGSARVVAHVGVLVVCELAQAGADGLLDNRAVDDGHNLLHELCNVEADVGDAVLAAS